MPNHPPYLNPESLVYGEIWPEQRDAPAKNGLVVPPRQIHDAARLATFRDSRGQPVTRWPEKVLPSTTVIIRGPLLKNGAYLLIVHQRSDNGFWGFVGGGMHPGESIRECAVREAYEETGLAVNLGPLVCIDSAPETGGLNVYGDAVVHYCNLTFLAQESTGTLRRSPESCALRWVSHTKLPEPFLPTHRWRWQQAQMIMAGGKVEVR